MDIVDENRIHLARRAQGFRAGGEVIWTVRSCSQGEVLDGARRLGFAFSSDLGAGGVAAEP